MGVVAARVLFLAFLVLTGTIIYNALYLQEHGPRGTPSVDVAEIDVGDSQAVPVISPDSSTLAAPPSDTAGGQAVSTDLPPLTPGAGESQLVVRAVERELAVRGYDVGPIDGVLSDKTRAAIAAFQKREGLPVTGVPSDDLLRQILLGESVAPPATTGSVADPGSIAVQAAEHQTVKGVQQVLADLGYAPGPIDGAWGENTSNAIRAFQRDRNIPVTGSITPELLTEFQRVTGRDFAQTTTTP